MRILKKTLAALGGMVVLFAIVVLTAPKTVHALTATLVQVVNPISNPVATADVARSASQNVLLFCTFPGIGVGNAGCAQVTPGLCFLNALVEQCSQYTVPPGQNLVIDSVEATQATGSVLRIDVYAYDPNLIISTTLDSYGVPGNGVTAQYNYPAAGLVIGPNLQPALIVRTTANVSAYVVLVGHLRPN
jgi:hypothetical protein